MWQLQAKRPRLVVERLCYVVLAEDLGSRDLGAIVGDVLLLPVLLLLDWSSGKGDALLALAPACCYDLVLFPLP